MNVLSDTNIWFKYLTNQQNYPCKYPYWNDYFQEILERLSSQAHLPIFACYMKSEFKCISPALKYSPELWCKIKRKKSFDTLWADPILVKVIWYFTEVSLLLMKYLKTFLWRRMGWQEILIIPPPSLSQGVSLGWHFLGLLCLRLIFQLEWECNGTFYLCVT